MDTENTDAKQLVVFNLGNEEYAINMKYAKEIIRIPEITSIPNVPEFIKGVCNIRGTVITVVDLKIRFHMKMTEWGTDSRLLVLEYDNMQFGIVVDDISEVIRTDQLQFQALGTELTGFSRNCIDGIFMIENRLILMLNANSFKTDVFQYIPESEANK
jgi:Chemotaxis signal transduction protein